MESMILSHGLISFLIFFILHLHHLTAHPGQRESVAIEYHNGRLLTGDINLSVLWYGSKAPETFRTFIQSLNDDGSTTFDPNVAKWWKMVESYQSALVEKATNGKLDGSTVAVIMIGEGVDLSCRSSTNQPTPCYEHGSIGEDKKQLYIVVKNQMRECGWICAWPFHKQMMMFQSGINLVVDPPTWDSSTHLSIIHFSSVLSHLVLAIFRDSQVGFVLIHRMEELSMLMASMVPSSCFLVFGIRVIVLPVGQSCNMSVKSIQIKSC